jgi:hypothetical protein
MRVSTLVIIACILGMMWMGASLHAGGVENIYNITSRLSFPEMNTSDQFTETIQETLDTNKTMDDYTLGLIRMERIDRVIVSFINFAGTACFEISMFFVEYGYEHPELDFEHAFKVIIIIAVLAFVIPLAMPLVMLICIIGISITHFIRKRKRKTKNKKQKRENEKVEL